MPTTHQPTLLIIDDNPNWIELASSYLGVSHSSEIDVNSLLTRSASEALQAIKTLCPDILVLDLNLTDYEDEEGVEIANSLHKAEINLSILLASANPPSYLQSIRPKFKTQIHIPGKNLLNLSKCINGTCQCL
jgi:CheY-like chemotaxis protein